MNTTITIELTSEERRDLFRLKDRMLAESRERKEIMDGSITKGTTFTDTSRDAERILPILNRMLSVACCQPNVTTVCGISWPTPIQEKP